MSSTLIRRIATVVVGVFVMVALAVTAINQQHHQAPAPSHQIVPDGGGGRVLYR